MRTVQPGCPDEQSPQSPAYVLAQALIDLLPGAWAFREARPRPSDTAAVLRGPDSVELHIVPYGGRDGRPGRVRLVGDLLGGEEMVSMNATIRADRSPTIVANTVVTRVLARLAPHIRERREQREAREAIALAAKQAARSHALRGVDCAAGLYAALTSEAEGWLGACDQGDRDEYAAARERGPAVLLAYLETSHLVPASLVRPIIDCLTHLAPDIYTYTHTDR